MQPITRATIDAFWARVTDGTILVCIANTYVAKSVGRAGVVTKPGKTAIRITGEDGRHFWLGPPRNVRDVLAIDGDAITYRIMVGEHTATWRIVPDRGADTARIDAALAGLAEGEHGRWREQVAREEEEAERTGVLNIG